LSLYPLYILDPEERRREEKEGKKGKKGIETGRK
jgi:hypothetical protein